MLERRRQVECVFIETQALGQQYGVLSESERERLYFDLMQGNGEYIADTGGLKKIRCGPGGHRGKSKKGWEVVFAEYLYSDIRKRVFLLLNKFPVTLDRTLSERHKKELRRLKAKADHYMGLYYERLQQDESSS